MKNKLSKFVPALLVAGVITITVPLLGNRAKAEPRRSDRAVAILYVYEDAEGPFLIWDATVSGSGLPEIKRGDSAATAIRLLLESGLSMTPQSGPLHYTLIR